MLLNSQTGNLSKIYEPNGKESTEQIRPRQIKLGIAYHPGAAG
jgi:hypothetical protein